MRAQQTVKGQRVNVEAHRPNGLSQLFNCTTVAQKHQNTKMSLHKSEWPCSNKTLQTLKFECHVIFTCHKILSISINQLKIQNHLVHRRHKTCWAAFGSWSGGDHPLFRLLRGASGMGVSNGWALCFVSGFPIRALGPCPGQHCSPWRKQARTSLGSILLPPFLYLTTGLETASISEGSEKAPGLRTSWTSYLPVDYLHMFQRPLWS